MKIEIDDKSGFCFGVVKAITKAEESLDKKNNVYCLGDIVHNKVEVKRLETLGLKTITHADLKSLNGKTVLIRAHGEPPSTYRLIEKYGIVVIDATCPVVARLQGLVVEAYRKMKEISGQVVILGKPGHAEVVGLIGQVDEDAIVVENIDDLDKVDFNRPIYLLSQTTQSLTLFDQVKQEILKRTANTENVIINDTICRQVSNRNPHLREFSSRFDVVIFVSGKKSSNGKALYESCLQSNPRTYKIEDESELEKEWFEDCESVGVCGATSTPKWLMERVVEKIKEIIS